MNSARRFHVLQGMIELDSSHVPCRTKMKLRQTEDSRRELFSTKIRANDIDRIDAELHLYDQHCWL